MKITAITVSAARKLPHPDADFASLSGYVSLTATLGAKDGVGTSIVTLQQMADVQVEAWMKHATDRIRQVGREKAASSVAQQGTAKAAEKLLLKHEPF